MNKPATTEPTGLRPFLSKTEIHKPQLAARRVAAKSQCTSDFSGLPKRPKQSENREALPTAPRISVKAEHAVPPGGAGRPFASSRVSDFTHKTAINRKRPIPSPRIDSSSVIDRTSTCRRLEKPERSSEAKPISASATGSTFGRSEPSVTQAGKHGRTPNNSLQRLTPLGISVAHYSQPSRMASTMTMNSNTRPPKSRTTKSKGSTVKTKSKKQKKRGKRKKHPNRTATSNGNCPETNPLQRRLVVSPGLARIVGGSFMTRAEATRNVWQYVKREKLQDPNDGRNVNCNRELHNVLGCPTFSMLQLGSLLKHHLNPPNLSEVQLSSTVNLNGVSRIASGLPSAAPLHAAQTKRELTTDSGDKQMNGREATLSAYRRIAPPGSGELSSTTTGTHREAHLDTNGAMRRSTVHVKTEDATTTRQEARENLEPDGRYTRGNTVKEGAANNLERSGAAGRADGAACSDDHNDVATRSRSNQRKAMQVACNEIHLVSSEQSPVEIEENDGKNDTADEKLNVEKLCVEFDEAVSERQNYDTFIKELKNGIEVDIWDIQAQSCELAISLMMSPLVYEMWRDLPFGFSVHVTSDSDSTVRKCDGSPIPCTKDKEDTLPLFTDEDNDESGSQSTAPSDEQPQPERDGHPTGRRLIVRPSFEAHPDFPHVPRLAGVVTVDNINPLHAYTFRVVAPTPLFQLSTDHLSLQPSSEPLGSDSNNKSAARHIAGACPSTATALALPSDTLKGFCAKSMVNEFGEVSICTKHLSQRSDPSTWSVADVCTFANSLRVPFLSSRFHEFGVNGDTLQRLTVFDLQALGLTAPFLIRRTLEAIKRMFSSDSSATGSHLSSEDSVAAFIHVEPPKHNLAAVT